jgi:type II secretory pathway pseudopilin PulG
MVKWGASRVGHHAQWRVAGGFAYPVLLALVALTGAAASSVLVAWSAQAQRDREAQLLWVARAYIDAIDRYYEASPGTAKRYPPDVNALLQDERFFQVRRHLRQAYPDPMTREADWDWVRAQDGGIRGLRSRSDRALFKRAGYPAWVTVRAATPAARDLVFEHMPRPAAKTTARGD